MKGDPEYVPVIGDWHGNIPWAVETIRGLGQLLPDDAPRIFLHVGDFGIWPRGGTRFLNHVDAVLAEVDAELWFVDGNHEDHYQLAGLAALAPPGGPVPVTDRITWLPRGYRWTWHGRRWLALGGATSVDRALRTEHVDWWAAEAITGAQAAQVAADGPADIMVCHDAPASVPLVLPPWPLEWSLRDKARADAHRDLLQDVVDAVKPHHLFHGHYHLAAQHTVVMGHGPVSVTSLDRDGAAHGHWQIVNTCALKELP